jgi:YD repeat-containing protein
LSTEPNGNGSADCEPKPSAGPSEAATLECPECRGSGTIVLLVTSGACMRCGGRGRIGPAARASELEAARRPDRRGKQHQPISDAQVVSRTYDAEGRLTSETWSGGESITVALSDSEPGGDDEPSDESDAEDSAG